MWILSGILVGLFSTYNWGRGTALEIGFMGIPILWFVSLLLLNALCFPYPQYYNPRKEDMEKFNLYVQKATSGALQCGVGLLLGLLLIME